MPFLYRMLQRLDPETAARLGVNDRYRIIRTLEIFFLSGIRKSQLSQMPDRFPALKFYLNPDRSELIDTIRKRTIAMIAAGWIEEVRTLMVEYPGFADMPAARSLGYHEIIRHLQGEMDRQKCTEIIIERTSQYAKRQLTWFRNQDGFAPLPPREELQQIVESVLQ
jgi:tRNA dimethylallyltransferase